MEVQKFHPPRPQTLPNMPLNMIFEMEELEKEVGSYSPLLLMKALIITHLKGNDTTIDWSQWKTEMTIECECHTESLDIAFLQHRGGHTSVVLTWWKNEENGVSENVVFSKDDLQKLHKLWIGRHDSSVRRNLAKEIKNQDFQLHTAWWKRIFYRIFANVPPKYVLEEPQ